MKNPYEAHSASRRLAKLPLARFTPRAYLKGLTVAGVYPEVPSHWPNRAVRRALVGSREGRLPSEWRQALMGFPALRARIAAL